MDELKVLKDIYSTCQACIEIIAIPLEDDEDIKPWQSKFGGLPYIPYGMEYPKDKKGELLHLLAQINLSDLPTSIKSFPKDGLLQFYIRDDQSYGMSDDNNDKSGFKIIYIPHQKNYKNPVELNDLPKPQSFPLTKKHKLIFREKYKPLPSGNPQYFNKFEKYIDMDSKDPDFFEIYDFLFTTEVCHQIGGYPSFAQGGPESYEYGKHTLQLLQISADTAIEFGDCGIANFLIKENDLKNLNFEDVVYYWDCY